MPVNYNFYKPIESKIRELKGISNFYYMDQVSDYANTLKKYGLGELSLGEGKWTPCGTIRFLTKEQIEKLPKYLRRGGEYDHNSVIIYGKIDDHIKDLCKIHNIKIIQHENYTKNNEDEYYNPNEPKNIAKSQENYIKLLASE